MTKLILVRHGQSTGNKLHIITGQGDFPLTELGREQANKAAAWLWEKETITKIYSSDLSRAMQTADPTAEAFSLPIALDARLRELDMGLLVHRPRSEWAEFFPDNWKMWCEDYPHYRAPEGESIPEQYARTAEALTQIAEDNDGECVAVFCHMGVMRCFETYVRGLPCDEIESTPKGDNASIAIYTYENGAFTSIAYNLCEHLEGSRTGTTFGL